MLLQVHGGGWTIGNKDQQGIPLMQHLAAKGWVCVAINYRLAPRDPFPAHIVDVKRAIAWIRENIAEYGGDPDYIAITGGSAGGHLAALAALTPERPRRTSRASRTPTPRCRRPSRTTASTTSPASTGLRSAELLRDRFLAPRDLADRPGPTHPRSSRPPRPILRITADAPDFFVLHGVHDTLVPVDQARLFVDEAARDLEADRRVRRAARRPARLRRVPVDPVRPRRARDRPLPALALERLPARASLKSGLRRSPLQRLRSMTCTRRRTVRRRRAPYWADDLGDRLRRHGSRRGLRSGRRGGRARRPCTTSSTPAST